MNPTDAGHAMGAGVRLERAPVTAVCGDRHVPRVRSVAAEVASAVMLIVVLAFIVIAYRARKEW